MTDRPRPLSSAARSWIVMGGAAVVGGVIGGGYAFLEHFGRTPGPALSALTLAVLFALVMAGTVWWWMKADEAVREAHKWAWYWGGTLGMCVGVVLLLLSGAYPGDGPLPPQVSQSTAMTTGACVVLVPMMLGYGVAWVAWWLSKGR